MGGLAGHMMHPHDNLNLTMHDFITIFSQTIKNNLPASEKLDGFNIHILNYNGEIRFARNSGDLINNGFGKDEIENRFSNERVREIFRKGFEMVEKDDRFLMIPEWELFHFTINAEIITGRTNIMYYDVDMIVPHNIFHWQKEGSKYITVSVDSFPGTRKQHRLPFTWISAEPDFNKNYWFKRIWRVFDGFTEDDTLADYYRYKFDQVVTAIMGGEYSPELIRAMFDRFFEVGEKVNLRELRRKFGSENVQKFIDIEKQLVSLTKDELDQLVLEMGTCILKHFRGLNWAHNTQYTAANILHNEIMMLINTQPEKTKMFIHRWMACDGNVFATEGIVVEYKGEHYKWTGPFAPINQLLGGNR